MHACLANGGQWHVLFSPSRFTSTLQAWPGQARSLFISVNFLCYLHGYMPADHGTFLLLLAGTVKKKKLRSPKLQFCNKSLLFIQVTARCQGRGEMRRSLLSESLEEQLLRPPHAAMWKRLGGSIHMVIGRAVGGRLGLLEWKAGSLCCAGWVSVTGSLSLVKWGRERNKGKELQSRNFLFFSSSPRLHMGCCVYS